MYQINCLIIGLGIGQLYKTVTQELGYKSFTVDPNTNLNADFVSVSEALDSIVDIDITIITVPNYLHYDIARQVANKSKIVLVEKPGVSSAQQWQSLVNEFSNTRFMMIKNNQYRENIKELFVLYHKSSNIKINWINQNRVPKPGSWFTNKELSFGGVSKDLLPHLLSLYTVFEPNYANTIWQDKQHKQKWTLNDLTDSDYGEVNTNGIYNVDDFASLQTTSNNKKISITADWRSMSQSDIGLHFNDKFIELGLCPQDAYKRMIQFAVSNINNNDFWNSQLEQDIWIHNQTS